VDVHVPKEEGRAAATQPNLQRLAENNRQQIRAIDAEISGLSLCSAGGCQIRTVNQPPNLSIFCPPRFRRRVRSTSLPAHYE
jgi:hypothetical protein